MDDYVDRRATRLKAQNEQQLQSQIGKLKAALKLVLLDRERTMKDAKDQHHLSKSACSHFAQFLPIIKHRLVQLLGEKDLRADVVKKIVTLRQNGVQVTFKHLWRLYGGPKVSYGTGRFLHRTDHGVIRLLKAWGRDTCFRSTKSGKSLKNFLRLSCP